MRVVVVVVVVCDSPTIFAARAKRAAMKHKYNAATTHFWPSMLLVSRGQTFRGRGTSGHYCQHSVIQWNFIRVTSRRSVTSKKCNCAMRAMRNWSFISAGLTSITRDCGVSLPRSMSNTRGSIA